MGERRYLNKKRAQLKHLTLALHGLNEQYSLLEPMLFDEELVKKHSNYGFTVIRQSLFFNCILDTVNLVKRTKKGVSIESIADMFSEEVIMKTLHDEIVYSDAFVGIPVLEQSQSEAFNKSVDDVKTAIEELLSSDEYESFKTIRNKRIAHIELKQVGDEYGLLDISTLGLKWEDLKVVIDKLSDIVSKLNVILTGVNIADRQSVNETMKNTFWNAV